MQNSTTDLIKDSIYVKYRNRCLKRLIDYLMPNEALASGFFPQIRLMNILKEPESERLGEKG